MSYQYDMYGWYSGIVPEGAPRSTDVAPGNLSLTETPGELRANFTGYVWVDTPFAEAPAPVEPPPAARRITKLAFRNRFMAAEKVALEIAKLDDPAAPMLNRQRAAALRASLADTQAASFIDLERPDTRAGVQVLESLGLLAAGRALQILDAEIQPEELPLADA
jgi:hypothetical protein